MDEEVVRALQEEFARVREYAERLYETRVNMDHANQAAIDVLISHLLAKLPSEEVDSWFDSDSDSDLISAKLIPEEERGRYSDIYRHLRAHSRTSKAAPFTRWENVLVLRRLFN